MYLKSVIKVLYNNKSKYAKRKSWGNDYCICMNEIGYANQAYPDFNVKPKPINECFLQLIKGNLIVGSYTPSIIDLIYNDWEIID